MMLPNISKFIKNYITKREKSFFCEDLINNKKKLTNEIEKEFPNIPNSRWIAFRLLEGDAQIIKALKQGELI